jgi:hypothetical protein
MPSDIQGKVVFHVKLYQSNYLAKLSINYAGWIKTFSNMQIFKKFTSFSKATQGCTVPKQGGKQR